MILSGNSQARSSARSTKYEKSFVYVLRAKELAKKTVLRYMKYGLLAKRILRARRHKTWQHNTRELAKKRFTLHEVRVAGKTCTSCKTTQDMATQHKGISKKNVLRYMKYVSQAKRVLRAKEIDKTDRFTFMKYVLRAKRVLRAKEIDKTDRFTLHEVRVAGKTCTSCKGISKKDRFTFTKYGLWAKRVLRAKEIDKTDRFTFMKYVSQAKRVLRAREEKGREEKRREEKR